MLFRKLGRTGIDVSLIGLGTMTYGQQNSEAEGHAQMDYAHDYGVNLFDTSELYSIPPKPETMGATERIIGSWFKARGNRDKVILATKVVGRTVMTWFRADGSPGSLTRAQITEALDGSLARLQTDYIDLYQLHWPDRATPFGANPTRYNPADFDGDGAPMHEVLGILQDFITAGKIRHIGVSNVSAWGTMRFIAESNARKLPRVQSIQNAYNLLNRTFDTALAEIAMRERVGLLAYSPLGQGYLTGKYLGGARPPGARNTLFNRGQRYELAGAEDATRAYLDLAASHGLDPAQMAIALVNQQPFVTSTLIGATTMEQLKINLGAIDVMVSPEVMAGIDAIHQRYGNPAP
jgi:aryl-alcohol dehydrogenase-like predicted oxidoreductase